MIDSCVRLTLDIQETSMPIAIKTKRGDTSRKLLINLSDGGVPYHITEECYAVFTAVKSDGTKINNPCTIKNCVIEYQFTNQTCAAVGRMLAEIKLYGADRKLITSASFTIIVFDTIFRDGDEVSSKDEMNTLDDLILRVNELLQEGLEEQVAEAIRDYLEKNPPEGGSGASPTITLSEFSDSTGSGVRIDIKNPDGKIYSYPVYNGKNGTSAFVSVTKTGNVTTITTQDATGTKKAEVLDGVQFETDATLKLENGVLSVNTTGDVEQDNTLPITSAGVFATVGNIEALLKTI